jgi:hypothetical protein
LQYFHYKLAYLYHQLHLDEEFDMHAAREAIFDLLKKSWVASNREKHGVE